jgi:Protein of unknown function (DUF3485)
MARILMLAIVAMVLLADGYLCGHWSGRWGDSQRVAADSLAQLPLVIGEWQGERLEFDPRIAKSAGFGGYLLRRYENQRTRATVTMLLASGRPGPLGVHTPEVCYAGAGFAQAGASTRGNVDRLTNETPAEFLQGKFVRKNQVQTEELRVVWTWNKNGTWLCPDNPRWTLTGVPVVYKLYVCQALVPGSEDGNNCVDFLRDALPELDRALVRGR